MSTLGSFIWSIADQLRGPYHPNQYGNVMSSPNNGAVGWSTTRRPSRSQPILVPPRVPARTNVAPTMKQEAIVIRVNGDDEAVRVANDTEYGLSSAVFSQNIQRAIHIDEICLDRVFHRAGNRRLRGKMNDAIGGAARLAHCVQIGDALAH